MLQLDFLTKLGGLRRFRFSFAVRMAITRSSSNSVAQTPRATRKRKTVESNKTANEVEPITPSRVKGARSTNKKPRVDEPGGELSESSKTTASRKSASPQKRKAAEDHSVTPKPFVPKYFLDLDPETTVIPSRLSFD